MTAPLNILFAGTPEFAATHLKSLVLGVHTVSAVLTQPDRRAGRGKTLRASPVKKVAISAGIPCFQPHSLSDPHMYNAIRDLCTDVIVVVAYGMILPQSLLAIPRLGSINVHASLLPRWRGAAPIQRAIEAGDKTTGVSIMIMEPGLDTGPVILSRSLGIKSSQTAGELSEELSSLGSTTLLEALENLEVLLSNGSPQDEDAVTYARKIHKSEALIDWSLSARTIARRIRAFHPLPGCYTYWEGNRLKIWEAVAETADIISKPGLILRADSSGVRVGCGTGVLSIKTLQLPGGTSQPVSAVLNGSVSRMAPGTMLNQPSLD